MKKFFSMIGEVIAYLLDLMLDVLRPVYYMLKSILAYTDDIMIIGLPYLMLYVGESLYHDRGYYAVGGEILLPVFIFFLVGLVRVINNRNNKGKNVPTPNKRFTEVDEDGEVSIPNDKLPELLLYVADLEDWMERKGLL